MKKKNILRYWLSLLFIVTASLPLFVSGWTVANASEMAQDTTPNPLITPVPDGGTGGNPAFFLPGWVILLIVGFIGFVLLLALLRPAFAPPPTPHHHDEPHDHVP